MNYVIQHPNSSLHCPPRPTLKTLPCALYKLVQPVTWAAPATRRIRYKLDRIFADLCLILSRQCSSLSTHLSLSRARLFSYSAFPNCTGNQGMTKEVPDIYALYSLSSPHFFLPAFSTKGTPDTLRSKKVVKSGDTHAQYSRVAPETTPTLVTVSARELHIKISPK